MQVNNVQSPNFGMALRIRPEAVDKLKQATRGHIEALKKAGEELKNTKYYHLEIGENGARTIVSPYANKYKGGSFRADEPTDHILKMKATWAGENSRALKQGDDYCVAISFADKEAALKAYQDLNNNLNTSIEKDVKIVKYLDEKEAKKIAQEEAEKAEKKAVGEMVDNLFSQYGV